METFVRNWRSVETNLFQYAVATLKSAKAKKVMEKAEKALENFGKHLYGILWSFEFCVIGLHG